MKSAAELVQMGMIKGLSIEEYHAGPGVSKSQLDQFAKSPAHYLASLTTTRKETPAMRIGSLFHGLVLEPERVKIAVAPVCDKRTKDGKYLWEIFCSENSGAEIVTAEEGEMLNGMLASLRMHDAARALLHNSLGIAEASAYWFDERSGELCRCRPDFYREDGIIVDLKTTDDASPEGFMRSIAKYNYHIQAAMYRDGVENATGKPVKGFVFVAVEKSAPYCTAVYQLDMQGETMGRDAYQDLLMDLADCKIKNKWPGYSSRVETISLPAWKVREAA